MRNTKTLPLTLDAHPGERDAHAALVQREGRLARDLERTPLNLPGRREDIERELDEIRAQMNTLAAVIESGIVRVTVTALSRGAWRNLLMTNAPREGDDLDQRIGYNGDTMPGALLRAATIGAVDQDGQTVPLQLDEWIDEDGPLAPGDFQQWLNETIRLQTAPVPPSPRRRAS